MSAARKRLKNPKFKKNISLLPKETAAAPAPPGRSVREIVRDVFFGLFVCFLFFFLVEMILRLASGPSPNAGDDPFVGFSSVQPLFRVDNGLATVSPSRLRYFNEISFLAQKPSQTVRIFCFGGSTTYGHPFDHRTSFSRWLEDLLQAAIPDKKIEVLNAGGISYASYRIVPLVREALQYNPDLMIIYMGHNEFLERRTYSNLFAQGSALVALQSLAQRLRLYQSLENFLAPLTMSRTKSQGSGSEGSSQSNKSILEGEVTAILDRSAGLDLYHRDDEFARGVVHHFGHNLKTMIAMCRKAGVPVILVDIPSNLKDFSPFKSEHNPNLTLRGQKELDHEIELADRLINEGDFENANARLDKILRKDPLFAKTHFLKGKALLGMKKYREAKDNFIQAKDLDVCPLRCISPIEEQTAKIAREEHVPLIPFKDFLEKRAREIGDGSGIPGAESFLDHVHPAIELHQLLAGMLLDQIVDHGMISTSRMLSPEERTSIFHAGLGSFDSNFMALRDFNLAKTLKWAGKGREAREALKRAVAEIHDNPEIHKMLGSFYLEDGQYDDAIREYTRAVGLSGNDPQMQFDLAVVYYMAGNRGNAVNIYEKLLEAKHNLPEVYSNLAMIYLETGKVAQAEQLLAAGMQSSSHSSALFAPYALALAVSGKASDAVPWMLKAVKAEPGDPNHLYNLAGMYTLTGKTHDAIRSLNLAVDKGYSNVEKLAQDRIFDSIRELPEFKNILARIGK